MEMTAKSVGDLAGIAEEFLKRRAGRNVFAFRAPMGAGKTTFISEVCRRLGVADDMGSPTFSILNEYASANGSPIYHFDFYRLESPEEALDMGAEEYFNSGELCLIEWPENIGTLLPEDAAEVEITVNGDGSRTFLF